MNKTIKQIIESALFSSNEPLSMQQLISLFDSERPTKNQIKGLIEELNQDYSDRSFEIINVASGYRVQVKEGYEEWISKLSAQSSNRYSKAFLETLVIIAYRQPVTRGDIEEIRGITVNPNIIRNLIFFQK